MRLLAKGGAMHSRQCDSQCSAVLKWDVPNTRDYNRMDDAGRVQTDLYVGAGPYGYFDGYMDNFVITSARLSA